MGVVDVPWIEQSEMKTDSTRDVQDSIKMATGNAKIYAHHAVTDIRTAGQYCDVVNDIAIIPRDLEEPRDLESTVTDETNKVIGG